MHPKVNKKNCIKFFSDGVDTVDLTAGGTRNCPLVISYQISGNIILTVQFVIKKFYYGEFGTTMTDRYSYHCLTMYDQL